MYHTNAALCVGQFRGAYFRGVKPSRAMLKLFSKIGVGSGFSIAAGGLLRRMVTTAALDMQVSPMFPSLPSSEGATCVLTPTAAAYNCGVMQFERLSEILKKSHPRSKAAGVMRGVQSLAAHLTPDRLQLFAENGQDSIKGVGLDFFLAGEVVADYVGGNAAPASDFPATHARCVQLCEHNTADFFTHCSYLRLTYDSNITIISNQSKADLRLHPQNRPLATRSPFASGDGMDTPDSTKHVDLGLAGVAGVIVILGHATIDDVCAVYGAESGADRAHVAGMVSALIRSGKVAYVDGACTIRGRVTGVNHVN